MARFLSAEWFDEVRRHAPAGPPGAPGGRPRAPGGPPATEPDGRFVIEQVVRATPDGDVRYQVVVDAAGARIVGPGESDDPGRPPDLIITSDWDTAAALARGELAAQAALAEGRLRIAGRVDRLSAAAAHLSGQDALPVEVRRATTFDRP